METHEQEMEALYSETIPEAEEGTVLKGTIITIRPDGFMVDIGYKSEGFIPIREFTDKEKDELSEGDEVEVYVSRIDADGFVILSIEKARHLKAVQSLEEAMEKGSPVEATVKEKVKGGYRVDISGIKAFLPGSQVDVRPMKSPDSLAGQKITVRILKFDSKLSNMVVSRRVLLEEEKAALREKTLAALKPGSLISGTVKNITDYGLFVDIGGIDGLLHVSDISWGRTRHPSSTFSIDQEIEVLVNDFDLESGKVSLGYKQKSPDPWLNIEEKYPVGKVVSGKVVNLTDYGAFIELEEGVEGLLHVSELDWSLRSKRPSDYMEIGDHIDAQVLKTDQKDRRLSLGLKQLKPKPWDLVLEKYNVGEQITGVVRSFTDFGTFIELPEGVDALLHISDMSWTRHIKHPSEVLQKGQSIEAVILSMDPEKERMSLGLKQIQPDPWLEEIPSRFHLGEEVKCSVLRQTEFGLFVEIEGGVEGLIYSSETGDRLNEEIKAGDEITAWIIKVDTEERKIGLSLVGSSEETVPDDKD